MKSVVFLFLKPYEYLSRSAVFSLLLFTVSVALYICCINPYAKNALGGVKDDYFINITLSHGSKL